MIKVGQVRLTESESRQKMAQEIDKRIMELCESIAKEANPGAFVDYITALNQLLEQRDKKLDRRIRLVSKRSD